MRDEMAEAASGLKVEKIRAAVVRALKDHLAVDIRVAESIANTAIGHLATMAPPVADETLDCDPPAPRGALSISKLKAAVQAMSPAPWHECCADQPESHPCRLIWNLKHDAAIASFDVDGERAPKADVHGTAELRNAADVMIMVVEAALAWRDSRESSSEKRTAAYYRIMDALSKVRQ